MKKSLYILSLVAITGSANAALILSEGFNEDGSTMISTLKSNGWAFANQSDTPDGTNADGWFPSSSFATPPATEEGSNAIAANFEATAGTTGTETISTWMETPTIALANGTAMDFWTESLNDGTASGSFADRMQVRLSTNGSSTNTGSGSSGVGDFGTLLLDINPNLVATGSGAYPIVYTHYTVTVSGLSSATTGRFAFRYFVADGGGSGTNSNAVIVDNVNVNSAAVPEPATITALGVGAIALIRRRRSRK